MNILLLVSAFNGLTQRAWCALRAAGHRVRVQFAVDEATMVRSVVATRPDLVLCPFLKDRVPAEIWENWRTVIIHPGPVGDRGPSSLDHAILTGQRVWGVTALQAVAEMDAGPIWATRVFAVPSPTPTKSELYNGAVADAALECVAEVVRKAADPTFVPTPLDRAPRTVPGTGLRPLLRSTDLVFGWDDEPHAIVRRIRAGDGFPGVRTTIAGLPCTVFDAEVGTVAGEPGRVIGRRDGAVLIGAGPGTGSRPGTGSHRGAVSAVGAVGSVWIGQVKPLADGLPPVKVPAVMALRGRLRDVPDAPAEAGGERYAPARYRRRGAIGEVTIRAYNGAMGTRQCRRIAAVLRHALRQDTRVLVIRSGFDVFSNGINLNLIETASDPAALGWANIRAINAICRQICADTRQLVIAAYPANAGAGGAMLGLGADVVVARDGVVFNPYYDIGLYGSELHTFALPARVGPDTAARLLADKLPVDAAAAQHVGLVDAVGPREPGAFDAWLDAVAGSCAETGRWRAAVEAKAMCAAKSRWPLSYHESTELAEMARDLFDNRSRFDEARRAFVYKHRPADTPARLSVG